MLVLDRRVAGGAGAAVHGRGADVLHHLIASHHGSQEYGAAVAPMTLEAEVLHYADDASAKTASMAEALADEDNFTGRSPVSREARLAARPPPGLPRDE